MRSKRSTRHNLSRSLVDHMPLVSTRPYDRPGDEPKLHFDNRIPAAQAIDSDFKANGCSIQERRDYWLELGYSEDFVREVVR